MTGNCTDTMFLDEEGKAIVESKQSNLVAASPMLSENSLDRCLSYVLPLGHY